MKILGLKLTHDGSISISEDNQLLLSWELEKFDNNNRFKILNKVSDLDILIKSSGHDLKEFDLIVIDGWVGDKKGVIKMLDESLGSYLLNVAPYNSTKINDKFKFKGLKVNDFEYSYLSYTHIFNHMLCAYMTSPFAKKTEPSYILIWDGGTFPLLYYFNPKKKLVKHLGPLFNMAVNIYSIFSQHFGPFKINENVIKDELSIAGKVMAYVALGTHNEHIFFYLKQTYSEILEEASNTNSVQDIPFKFAFIFKNKIKDCMFSDEDIISTFHYFLEELLVTNLSIKIKKQTYNCSNLCYAGGAALNIKWNSTLRKKVPLNLWIPPFPNDSGSSIGAVCSGVNSFLEESHLEWNAYSGPPIKSVNGALHKDWDRKLCDFNMLARILYILKEPVILLSGNAEIGPRALGNRSIIADPTLELTKTTLNAIKFRESYRPIAPVCLEERAERIFNPGTPDPFMLFEHYVKEEWIPRIPGAVHKDGSARLQTVTQKQNPILYNILIEYEKLSSIPVLLNTSANYKGSGFFPDINSAISWNKIDYIWSEGYVFFKKKSCDKLLDLITIK